MRLPVVFLLLLGTAHAHHFWIEPSTFRPRAGDTATLRLRIGDALPGEAYARNPRHMRRFVFLAGDRVAAVAGRPGSDPAGTVSGPGIAVYESRPTRILLSAEAFERYLEEEGLDSVARQRRERGETDRPGRERYSRCAKALLGVRDRRVGLALELVREDAATFRLYRDGRPLAGALVHAFRPRGSRATARSGAGGRVRLRLGPGAWVLGAVHMARAPRGAPADWDSVWTSLTFLNSPEEKQS